MTFRGALLLAGVLVAWLALPLPASADPITAIATAIAAFLPAAGPVSLAAGAGFGFGAVTWAVAQGIATLVVAGGLTALNYLVSPKPGGAAAGGIDPGAMKEQFENADAAEVRLVGRGRVSGLIVFGNTSGANRYRLYAHFRGPGSGVENFYLGGREVTVDFAGSGQVTSPPWGSDSGSFCAVQIKNGDGSETAWPDLIAAFSGLWTSAHRVRGVAQTLVRFASPGFNDRLYLTLYQNGVPPLEAVWRGENNVYDPRTLTYRWDECGITNALHILRSYPELSDLALYDLDYVSAQANMADAQVLRKGGGTTRRSRCWGFWSSEQPRGETMQQVLDSIGAVIVLRNGGTVDGIVQVKLGIELLSETPVATVTIPAKHIIDLEWSAGPEGVERPNVCRVWYYSPERNYTLTELDLTGVAWARIDSEIDQYGEKPFDLKLPFCPDAGQAQRIAYLKFALARAETGVAHTNMAGLAVWGERFVNIELPDDLGTILCAVGVPRVSDADGVVEIPFVVWPDLPAYNPETDEVPAPDELPDINSDNPLTRPNAPLAASAIMFPDASTETRIIYSLPGDAVFIEVVYRTYTDNLPTPWRKMNVVTNNALYATIVGGLTGQIVDFRLRSFNGLRMSQWSPVLTTLVTINNTAPSAPLIGWDGTNVVVIVAFEVQVSYVVVTDPFGTPTTTAVHPGQTLTYPPAGPGTWTARSFASNGTGSPVASVTIPP